MLSSSQTDEAGQLVQQVLYAQVSVLGIECPGFQSILNKP
jgi:hypothetical protein